MTGSPLEVKLDAFEGPLDLLLHLIKKHEIDIFDIPIRFITEAFLDTLAEMERMDLEIGGEFLVMAATLAQIKSKLLLPRPKPDEDELEDDPRAELVEQLLEYQRYRELAEQLNERELLGREVFARPGPDLPPDPPTQMPPGSLDVFQLIEAFERIKKRAGFRRRLEVTVARRTINAEIARIARLVAQVSPLSFWALVERDDDGDYAVVSVVGVFLALLEMTRRGLLDVLVDPNDPGNLLVEARTESDELEALAERVDEA